MSLEKFASRGLKAQAGIDRFIADHKKVSPAPTGASPGTGAGESATSPPRSSAGRKIRPALTAGMFEQINSSTDAVWLKSVMNSQDYQISVRTAAQRRLAKLFRKPRP